MNKVNNAYLSLGKRIQQGSCLVGLGLAIAALSQTATASCTYSIESQWSTGFTANITIKNDTGAPLNAWNVSWQYANNRVASAWNATLSGSNPYSASNLSWNGSIPVGQSVSFGFQGSLNGSAAERPTVTGAACNGGTSVSSSRSSSSSTPSASVTSSSTASTQSTLVIQESQAGFCRLDGTVDTNHAGYTGSGFANGNNAQGAVVSWAVQASTSSRHRLTFRFANGGTTARSGSLLINGGANGNYTLNLPSTGAWATWQTASIDVDLVQGNNTLQLSASTAEGLANIDSLSVVGATTSPGSCGTVSSSSRSSSSSSRSSSSVAATCELKAPLKWTSTGPLISPKTSGWASIKDPSVVKYNGTYHVYATYYDTAYKSMYTSFTDWNNAQAAPHISMNGSRVGNTVAPQVFFFRPHNKWYLITQWGGAYATTDNIASPNWSAKQKLLQGEPSGALDFWVICNDTHCYLYFSRDDGVLYMSKTTIGNFPNFSGYSIVMEDHRGNGNQYLFEAPNVYKLDGQNKYLLMVEAYISGPRLFRSWTSSSLDGPWTALADTDANPFAGNNNVTWPSGKWADGISHGELIRSGYDERLTVDPCNLEFLYQGQSGPGSTYNTIPYKLGLLRLNK